MEPYRAHMASERQANRSEKTRLDSDMLLMTVKIATACRAELETLCIIHGIAFRGRSAATLREALKERLTGNIKHA